MDDLHCPLWTTVAERKRKRRRLTRRELEDALHFARRIPGTINGALVEAAERLLEMEAASDEDRATVLRSWPNSPWTRGWKDAERRMLANRFDDDDEPQSSSIGHGRTIDG